MPFDADPAGAFNGSPEASHGLEPTASPSRRVEPPARRDKPLPGEIAFLHDAGLGLATLREAARDAQALGVSADAALLAGRHLGEDDFYRALARHLGVPFLTRHAAVASGVDYAVAAKAGFAPLQRWPGGPRWIVAPRGAAITTLPRRLDPRDVVLTSPRRFEGFLRRAAADRIAADAASTLDGIAPELTARRLRLRQAWPALAGFVALMSALVWLDAALMRWVARVALWGVFSLACGVRLRAMAASGRPEPEAPPLSDAALPTYTIVVALYREANVAVALVNALERIDYPRAKLDVKFVVEEDDRDTLAVLARAMPGVEYDIVVAPAGAPRTKPRALDVALPFARGELLTVFDAEDVPEPAQLRRAAARFADAAADLACLQARLVIDNAGDGFLQGLFALDYAALFEVVNPGLAALRMPIFLGGSSNHFRTAHLVAVGGWDAWNVTEDADLGLRLARRGLRVETLRSHTREEAPAAFRDLFRQRMRWMKGWLQTLGVHLRDPRAFFADLGLKRGLAALALFVSGVIGPMCWPVYAALLVFDAVWGELLAFRSPMDAFASVAFVTLASVGAATLIGPWLLGAKRQNRLGRLRLLPLLPLWHAFLFAAAWLALIDLARNPFGWMKTPHGQAKHRAPL